MLRKHARRVVVWIFSAVLLGLVAVPLIQQNVQKLAAEHHWDEFLSSRYVRWSADVGMLIQHSWFWFALGFFAGGAGVGWLLELLPRRSTPADKATMEIGYVPTRLVLRKSDENENYYEADVEKSSNIFRWNQLVARAEVITKEVVFHNDSFFLVFETSIRYGWPRVNSFGHPFPLYNFHALTNRSAVLQVNGEINAPVFEIEFPPEPGASLATSPSPPPLSEEARRKSIRGQGGVGPARRPA